jgi:hypothetical protein
MKAEMKVGLLKVLSFLLPDSLQALSLIAARPVLERLESVLSSVTPWKSVPNPLPGFMDFWFPVPESTKSGT